VDPTCGTYGYDLYQCKCGEEKYENRTEMKGDHQFKTVEETDDSIAYECEVCSAYYAEDK
jgi:redox-regulated HSP33 family molecular chaperone